MSVAEAKKRFDEARGNVQELLKKQQELIQRQDDVRENLPRLEHICQEARSGREKIADLVVLGERPKSELIKADERLTEVEKNLETERLLHDAIARQVKVLENNLPKKHGEIDLAKRQIWEAIVEEIKGAIDAETFKTVERYMVAILQLGGSYEAQLQKLFARPLSERFQEVYKKIAEQYKID